MQFKPKPEFEEHAPLGDFLRTHSDLLSRAREEREFAPQDAITLGRALKTFIEERDALVQKLRLRHPAVEKQISEKFFTHSGPPVSIFKKHRDSLRALEHWLDVRTNLLVSSKGGFYDENLVRKWQSGNAVSVRLPKAFRSKSKRRMMRRFNSAEDASFFVQSEIDRHAATVRDFAKEFLEKLAVCKE